MVYCALIALVFMALPNTQPHPAYLNIISMLTLLVFSAAITGSLVFGYAVYLFLDKKAKEALSVLGYTLLFLLCGLVVTLGVVLSSTFQNTPQQADGVF
ncbi:hypothetical protein HY933_00300 [Candidatus Falkowbacteria bacterium]|nr:hypothetical protein [Candidatus Falkowbacteria bacterium]